MTTPQQHAHSGPGDGGQHLRDLKSVDADKQNNTEINLTRKVNDGTFSDILDAIANADTVSSVGDRCIIEPGTYQASTQGTILYSDRQIVTYGGGHTWNANNAAPVVIEWTGTTGGGEVMLTFGDGSTQVEGLTFHGIEFVPSTLDAAVSAVEYAGNESGGGQPIRDVTWHRCRWNRLGAKPLIVTNSATDAFDLKYIDCAWWANDDISELGSQAQVRGGYIGSSGLTSVPAVRLMEKGQVWGTSGDANSNETLLRADSGAIAFPGNFEGANNGGVGVEVHGAEPTYVGGGIYGMATEVEIAAENTNPLFGMLPKTNSGQMYDFQGGQNDHNGSVVMGAGVAAADITLANDNNSIAVWSDNLSHTPGIPSDVVGSRSLGTWYQNTTGVEKAVSIRYSVSPSSGTSIVRMGADVNFDQTQNRANWTSIVGTSSTTGIDGCTFIVPNDAYYKVSVFGDTGDGSLDAWYEQDFNGDYQAHA